MVYDDATWFWNCYAGLPPPFEVARGSPPAPYKNINRNTACSIYLGGIHYKSGDFYQGDHHGLLKRLNHFAGWELSGEYFGIGKIQNV